MPGSLLLVSTSVPVGSIKRQWGSHAVCPQRRRQLERAYATPSQHQPEADNATADRLGAGGAAHGGTALALAAAGAEVRARRVLHTHTERRKG